VSVGAKRGRPERSCFESVVCYGTGLDVAAVSTVPNPSAEVEALCGAYENFRSRTDASLRLESGPLKDLVVRTTLEVAAECSKPGIISRCSSILVLVTEVSR